MVTLEKDLTALLEQIREEDHLPGIDCSVWHHHQPVFRHMSGVEDLATGAPITENTLYNIYSNTKVITCVAAMQLYERGLFLLEDKLERFFPEFAHMQVLQPDGTLKSAERSITIRDLFRMTAGIGDGDDYAEMGMKFYMETGGACPGEELPKYLAQCPLFFEPGTKYRYGICHEVLAALIAKLSGESFGQYLNDHIFQPLGMDNTAFSLEGCRSKSLADQYEWDPVARTMVSKGSANCLIPPILKESASGGLISSVDDYMKFQEALCRENVLLSKRTTDLMRLDQLSGTMRDGYGYTGIGMGYGLGVRTTIDQAALGAPVGFGPYGWGGAAGTYGSIDPENEITIFYAQHVFGVDGERSHARVRNLIYSALG